MAVLPVAREVLVQTVGDVRKGQFWQEAHKMFSAPRSGHVKVAAGPLCLCGGKSVQFFFYTTNGAEILLTVSNCCSCSQMHFFFFRYLNKHTDSDSLKLNLK